MHKTLVVAEVIDHQFLIFTVIKNIAITYFKTVNIFQNASKTTFDERLTKIKPQKCSN